MPRRHYRGDPHWITVRYRGKCAKQECPAEILPGEQAFYYPRTKSLYCSKYGHAEAAARDFETMAEAEDFLGRGPASIPDFRPVWYQSGS